ncbi:MAG TPA: hypothetical protein DIS66_05075 [Candidatus Omnitrophica bacterium]|nr:hypothetical protein [Candidatus Omnitrophota bacterium]
MKSIEYLTAFVLAQRSLNKKPGPEIVLWADLLLAQGLEFDEVKNIICLEASASDAQKEKALDDCFTKLGISLLDEKSAHLLLIWAWVQRLLTTDLGADDFLEGMYQLCVQHQHEPVYMQFYLLRCAKGDLSKGSIVFHDRELNEHNFEQVLRWEASLFLDQHEHEILNWIQIKNEK